MSHPPDDLAALRGRVRRLERLESARGLLHDYAAAVDRREVAPVVALFAPHAVLDSPRGVFTGYDEIARSYRDAWTLEPSRKRHFTTSPRLTAVTDDVVAATAYFLYVGRDTDRSVIGWGTYADRIDVSAARPVFLSKTITVHLTTDLDRGWPLSLETS